MVRKTVPSSQAHDQNPLRSQNNEGSVTSPGSGPNEPVPAHILPVLLDCHLCDQQLSLDQQPTHEASSPLEFIVLQLHKPLVTGTDNPLISRMGFIQLDLPCPKTSPIVAMADPQPQWSLGDLLSEINALELRLGYSTSSPLCLKQPMRPDFSEGKGKSVGEPFIMCISDNDVEDSDSADEESSNQSLMIGTRFSCGDLDLSESEGSEDEAYLKVAPYLMHKKSLEEGILFEFDREHELQVKEEIRCRLSSLDTRQKFENEWSSAVFRLEKYIQERQETDWRLDKQYQRKIAQVMDNHLSAIQRDHEQRSQIEERRIRDDAAAEEARRRERALLEEMVRQEKAKVEAEARQRAAKLAEEAQKAALEAALKESKEAAEKEAAKARATEAAHKRMAEHIEVSLSKSSNNMGSNASKGVKVLAADSALKVEESRLKFYDEVTQEVMFRSNEEFESCGNQISKRLRQINTTQQKVRSVSAALIGIINGPEYPRSISSLLVAQKVVSLCECPNASFDSIVFAWGHAIVIVTSQVPAVMDLLLAALHKACIYTVPKHLQPEPTSKSNDYLKMIGYLEKDGRIESSDSYLKRVESYMKLYAALIQTEVPGIRNPHSLKEGWAWLSRFLNNLPANNSTAVALHAFLKMAGFALFRRYRSQFRKILNFISDDFLPALKKRDDAGKVFLELEQYLQSKAYLREPEGRSLQSGLLSRELV
ncbi:hypothetical protein J5N97_007811 [Dioscorea zingiberensis]|uniref:mRNA export factor GLE1 n=1 Tax=Dioscorea zingiberensis TaxID=325984 RepID=A0A9D5DF79_9LILI|nr:hypothetical protein J5N97_007811 [Dioscorea zingiberensis]